MPRQKTSKAVIYHARFNPINPKDADAINIIESLVAQGFNFKQIAQDAILRSRGRTPEMYADESTLITQMLTEIRSQRELLEKAVTQAARTARNMPSEDVDDDGEEGVSPFARGFVNSFMQRQQQSNVGDDDDV